VNKENHDQVKIILEQQAKNLLDIFTSVGVTAKYLKEQDILKYIYSYLNPSRVELLEIKNLDKTQTLRSQVCFNACETNFEDIKMDGVYSRGINLFSRPSELNFAMFANFVATVPSYSDIVLIISTKNQDKENNKLIRDAN
jgi:hypothetical protein